MTRQCRECTLCCKLVPVGELGKPANTRCKHQCSKGCRVYDNPLAGFPLSCAAWSCAWLKNIDADDLPRPDRAHYVIDTVPDFIDCDDADGRFRVPVVQVWVDPKHRQAHRDPKLRAWIERRARVTGQVALIRFGNAEAMVLCPPSLSSTKDWQEKTSEMVAVKEHSMREVFDTYEQLAKNRL